MSTSKSVRAIVVDPAISGRLVIREVERATPLPNEAIVQVASISLNRGEVRRSQSAAAGWRPGWDLAGTIVTAAQDSSGFPVGTRVVGFLPAGAWAEQVAVPTHAIAALPDSVSFTAAATLPVAGLTALLCLERVGYFACQIANQSGAIVTAQVRRPELIEFVKNAGAHQVIVGDGFDEYAPYDLVLDSVGGEVLPLVLNHLAPDGTCVMFGATAGSEIMFNASRFYGRGGLSLYGFILFHELKKQPAAAGLARLVKLVADGVLMPHVDLEAPWSEITTVAQQLTDRQFLGKAVLHI
jgi:NADPH:quinone reductase